MPRVVKSSGRLPRNRPVPIMPVAPVTPADSDSLQPSAFPPSEPAPPIFQMPETAPVPYAVAPPRPDAPAQPAAPVLSEGSLSPRAGVMRGGGLFLRPQWLSYDGARRGLAGLGQTGQTCWLINKWTGERVIWTGQNWHVGPDADWYSHCEYYADPLPPNTFQPAPPASPPAPASSPPAPASSPPAPPSSPVPSPRPPSGNVPVIGPLPGLDNLAPSEWGGEGPTFPAGDQQGRAGFPWWLVAIAGAVMLS